MTWPEILDTIENGCDAAILPLGATEQHEPHLGTGMDSVIAEKLCLEVSKQTGMPMLPTLTYGCSIGQSHRWPGTLALSPATFIAGILKHGPALCATFAPTVNSYKRLVHRGLMSYYSWAPVYNSCDSNNRTNSLRVPMASGRVESRNADAACNPYLAAALALAAGLESIKKQLDPGNPQEDNLYEPSPAELEERGISELPRNLDEAVAAFAADPFVEKVSGSELRQEFITYKSEEWRQYHQRISQWEIDQYARLF